MHSCLARVVVAALALTGLALPAAAQERPAGDVAFSYAFLKDSDIEGTFGLGWIAAGAGKVSRSWDLVGEVGGAYRTISAPGIDLESSIDIHTFAGGPRYVMRPSPRATVFVQALLGAARISFGLSSCGSLPTEICAEIRDVSVSRTFFMIQPGLGVDVAITKRTGIRLTGDYRAVRANFAEGDAEAVLHEFRFGAGVVFRFG